MNLKNLHKVLACGLLTIGYLCAVIGFDIHTDGHDNRTYVVSLFSALTCEDIHPDDQCHCCHHHHDESSCPGDDCQDDVQVITLTGTDHTPVYTFTAPLLAIAAPVFAQETVSNESVNYEHLHFCGLPPRRTLCQNCILRV